MTAAENLPNDDANPLGDMVDDAIEQLRPPPVYPSFDVFMAELENLPDLSADEEAAEELYHLDRDAARALLDRAIPVAIDRYHDFRRSPDGERVGNWSDSEPLYDGPPTGEDQLEAWSAWVVVALDKIAEAIAADSDSAATVRLEAIDIVVEAFMRPIGQRVQRMLKGAREAVTVAAVEAQERLEP